MDGEDPVTLTTAMMAATAGSAAIGATESIAGGFQARAAGSVDAAALRQKAREEMVAAGSKIAAGDYKANQLIASDEAKAGASGVTPDSFMPVLSENAAEQRINDLYTRYEGKLAQTSDLYAAKYASWSGKQALYKGLMGGATNVLGGLTQIGELKMMGNLGVGPGGTP